MWFLLTSINISLSSISRFDVWQESIALVVIIIYQKLLFYTRNRVSSGVANRGGTYINPWVLFFIFQNNLTSWLILGQLYLVIRRTYNLSAWHRDRLLQIFIDTFQVLIISWAQYLSRSIVFSATVVTIGIGLIYPWSINCTPFNVLEANSFRCRFHSPVMICLWCLNWRIVTISVNKFLTFILIVIVCAGSLSSWILDLIYSFIPSIHYVVSIAKWYISWVPRVSWLRWDSLMC